MRKKNLKCFLLFLVSLIFVAGTYMLANRLMFSPIWAIYQIVTVVTVCIYIYLYMSNEKKTEKEQSELTTEEAEKKAESRKNVMKIFVAIFLPFLITILCDYTYLLLLSEQEWFKSLTNIFS